MKYFFRECFEESGILYLEKNGELITETSLPVKELGKWRTDVENDAKLFYELCKELDAWPAVNRLFDWDFLNEQLTVRVAIFTENLNKRY